VGKIKNIKGYCLLFLFLPALAFAKGKTDADETDPLNKEWALTITAFDVSVLSENQGLVADLLMRDLVNSLKVVDYRIRLSEEQGWYESYAWAQKKTAAAKALEAKRFERDALVYRGDPNWKYKASLKTIDAQIADLEEDLRKAETEAPPVAAEPEFKLADTNRNGTFPAPPEAGKEYKYCKDQSIDAFLTGKITEYYDRIYITLELYTLYSRMYIYQDDIIFSADDSANALSELSGRLVAAVSGSTPARIAVKAEPENALVLINNSYAGTGGVTERERPPGKVTVRVSAEDYQTQSVETEIAAGELTEFDVHLNPLSLSSVNVNIPGMTGALVYQGSLFVGETPLTLRFPIGRLEYINVETPDGKSGSAVFVTADKEDAEKTVTIKPKILPTDKNRVDRARRIYYWAWGGTWISGILAWITYGIFTTYNDANTANVNAGIVNEDVYNTAVKILPFTWITMGLVGLAVGHEFFQMGRYIHTAGADATPVQK
jgi:hypothetical protein